MKKEITIYIMTGFVPNEQIQPFYDAFIDDLQKKLKMTIHLRILTWRNVLSTLISDFKNSEGPDVFQLGSTWVNTFAQLGYLAPLPEGISSAKPIAPWMSEVCRYQGNCFAMPWIAETVMILANRNHLADAGISIEPFESPAHWSRICEQLCSLYKETFPERIPLLLSLRPDFGRLHILSGFMRAFGCDFPDMHTIKGPILDPISLKAAFSYLKGLFQSGNMDKYLASQHPAPIYDAFYQQRIATFTAGQPWCAVTYALNQEDESNFPYSALPLPAGPAGHAPWGGGSMLCVSSKSSHPQAAWQVVQEMTSHRYMETLCRLGGALPAMHCPFWEEARQNEQLSVIYQELCHSRHYPKHPLWMPFERIFSEGLSSLLWQYLYSQEPFTALFDRIVRPMEERIFRIHRFAWGVDREG